MGHECDMIAPKRDLHYAMKKNIVESDPRSRKALNVVADHMMQFMAVVGRRKIGMFDGHL